jgi:hypothetical protein
MSLRNFLVFSAAALSVAATACGGNVSTGAGGNGGNGAAGGGGNGAAGGGGNGGAGNGGAGNGGAGATGGGGVGGGSTGDCATEADCGGAPCAEVTPGGFKVCLSSPPEATACGANQPQDQCCTSADCSKGKCYLSTSFPYCGGPAMAEYNLCAADQCASAADCKGDLPAICTPAGAFGWPVRECVVALCETNADCNAKQNGYCAPVNTTCCNVPAGLACVYPGGCRADADCASDGSKHCELDQSSKSGVCKDGPALCPA